MAAIWLRIIMTLFYNAHQSDRLFKYKQSLPSFASFCRDAARSLGQRSRPKQNAAIPKREHFKTDPDWIRLRLSKRFKHQVIRIEGEAQNCCVLCCQISHDVENVGHTRKGFITRFQCSDCKVALCQVARWNGETSCLEKFHSDKELPDPCKGPEQVISTQVHTNRAPPPSRKRQHSIEIPNRRASSTRLEIKERRRSLRLRELQ
ncbi:hypothetical protein PHYSODRAFT_319024 [Phytophthora sojae]|uniref:PiggyBac transposable element-derived protein 4 C-terminal zinc-ribbon domain-containing protein n=1 Tax=Phytophthora sojae (strain P6497) TaxID=1094619 RepID=G5A7U5_PHYSP|nr:hypothetical protein PHYSODRAFT_319024 [Phytophthora sojae]EGZ07971.1 hypothetical protein PHYSODRAFT_319024 [Phytophthora sojae]|eukprot:XP_009536143.1 hypothetical protein PHYSODRAFT_319024 [Phytophthora sojae]